AHRNGRDQEQEQPRVIAEERIEVSLAALEEPAEVEREEVGEYQEDQQEDVGQWRGEVAGQFPAQDDADVGHGVSLGGDGSEDFIESPALQVQILESDALRRGE